jgi:uncharacterized protein YcfJ
MRKYIFAASLSALAIGTAVQAAPVCKQDNTGRVVATIAGAGIGAVLGNMIDGGSNRTAGTIVGGVAGGVAGNQLAKSDGRCERAYGYYDEGGRWHANRISSSEARGYYDRDNRWVDGSPNGYYDSNNRWVGFQGDAAMNGYSDRDGRWVPVGVSGYYAADNQWVPASAPGYYDTSGRWVAGPAAGYYNANGNWVQDSSRYASPTGSWSAQSQPGHYADGRWVRGQTTGYYDARGRWVSTGGASPSNVAYNSGQPQSREQRISQRIERMVERGQISPREARSARSELEMIRRDENRLRRTGGRYTAYEERVIGQRLDRLATRLRVERDDQNNAPG